MSFGSELRHQREDRGVGLAEIAAATKLSERYLRALEADEHNDLPGGIFNKGMVRGYCRHLGLDEQEWLTRFATSCETQGGEPDWSAFAENVKATRVRTGASSRRWWGVLLMVIALAGLAWAAWHFFLSQRISRPKPNMPAVGSLQLPGEEKRAPSSRAPIFLPSVIG